MQDSRPSRPKVRLDRKAVTIAVRFARQYKKHPEAIESLLAEAQKRGASEQDTAVIRMFLTASRDAALDHEANYRIDQYLTAGVGALDLVLLPTILPMGVADGPLYVALGSLSVSLILVSSSLVVSFIKRDVGIVGYGWLHSTLISMTLVSGVAALTATLWHYSLAIALMFLILSVVAFFACIWYANIVRTSIEFLRLQQQAPPSPEDQSEDLSDATTGASN